MENYLSHKMLIDISMVGTAKSERYYIENMETNFLRQSLWDVSKYDRIGLSDLRGKSDHSSTL